MRSRQQRAAKCFVAFRPETATVVSIVVGPPSVLTVDDASAFLAGDEIRIRSADGSDNEVVEIDSILGNVITLTAGLVATYSPGSEDVQILFRAVIPEGTTINTLSGVVFATLEDVYTGDANPVLNGESTFLGLLDKVWCEATEKGAAGNVEPLAVTALVTPIRGVLSCFNPEPGSGGADIESDFDLKYRAMHQPTIANQETHTWIEAICRAGNSNVLRAIKVTSSTVATMACQVLHRNGGTFTTAQLTAMEEYAEQRVRSYMKLDVTNVTLQAIEVEASITLDPDVTLAQVGIAASSLLAAFLDYRKLPFSTDDEPLVIDEADLLAMVKNTTGVATLETASFLPAADTTITTNSIPTLARLSLTDLTSGDTWNADLAVSF